MRYRIKVLTTRSGVRYVPQCKRWVLWITLHSAMYIEPDIRTEKRAREHIHLHYTQWLNAKRTAKPFYIPVSPIVFTKPT